MSDDALPVVTWVLDEAYGQAWGNMESFDYRDLVSCRWFYTTRLQSNTVLHLYERLPYLDDARLPHPPSSYRGEAGASGVFEGSDYLIGQFADQFLIDILVVNLIAADKWAWQMEIPNAGS